MKNPIEILFETFKQTEKRAEVEKQRLNSILITKDYNIEHRYYPLSVYHADYVIEIKDGMIKVVKSRNELLKTGTYAKLN